MGEIRRDNRAGDWGRVIFSSVKYSVLCKCKNQALLSFHKGAKLHQNQVKLTEIDRKEGKNRKKRKDFFEREPNSPVPALCRRRSESASNGVPVTKLSGAMGG